MYASFFGLLEHWKSQYPKSEIAQLGYNQEFLNARNTIVWWCQLFRGVNKTPCYTNASSFNAMLFLVA
ncbi:hypothetical protein VCRA2110O2_30051 [Vibrio crassostreae]|nr:hypothetical protein VCRA2110O2_30051 [Vibrio crassostreae]